MMISALVFIDYSDKTEKIIIKTNDSESEWENILNQVKKNERKNTLFITKADSD